MVDKKTVDAKDALEAQEKENDALRAAKAKDMPIK